MKNETTKTPPVKQRGGLAATLDQKATAPVKAPATGKAVKAAKVVKPGKAVKTEKPLGKCAFIDALYIKGGLTIAQIYERTMEAFPGAEAKPTMSTVRARPAHIRAYGKIPKWKTEPKKAKV